MNPSEVFHYLDEVLHVRLDLHARPVGNLEVLHDLGHLLPVEVEERLDQISVDEALKSTKE